MFLIRNINYRYLDPSQILYSKKIMIIKVIGLFIDFKKALTLLIINYYNEEF